MRWRSLRCDSNWTGFGQGYLKLLCQSLTKFNLSSNSSTLSVRVRARVLNLYSCSHPGVDHFYAGIFKIFDIASDQFAIMGSCCGGYDGIK